MIRRMTLGTFALALTLLVLVGQPATAKGPNQVEVHDLKTGTTTLLTEDRTETWALMQLVEWPEGTSEPRGIGYREARARRDAVMAVPRRHRHPQVTRLDGPGVLRCTTASRGSSEPTSMSEPAVTTWGRIRAPMALEAVLAGLDRPAKVPTVSQDKAATVAAPPPPRATTDGWDGASFGWGAGSAGILAVGLLGAWKWRQRSVTASRNSRVSMPAAS